MYELSAFAFTPAAIISDANVCRHSCRLTGSSAFGFALFQAVSATPPVPSGTMPPKRVLCPIGLNALG
jgi:hypothetical protein